MQSEAEQSGSVLKVSSFCSHPRPVMVQYRPDGPGIFHTFRDRRQHASGSEAPENRGPSIYSAVVE